MITLGKFFDSILDSSSNFIRVKHYDTKEDIIKIYAISGNQITKEDIISAIEDFDSDYLDNLISQDGVMINSILDMEVIMSSEIVTDRVNGKYAIVAYIKMPTITKKEESTTKSKKS